MRSCIELPFYQAKAFSHILSAHYFSRSKRPVGLAPEAHQQEHDPAALESNQPPTGEWKPTEGLRPARPTRSKALLQRLESPTLGRLGSWGRQKTLRPDILQHSRDGGSSRLATATTALEPSRSSFAYRLSIALVGPLEENPMETPAKDMKNILAVERLSSSPERRMHMLRMECGFQGLFC